MIYKETDQVEVGYDEDIAATYMIFKKQVNEDDFISTHHYVIDMLKTRRYTTGKHLVDTSQLKVITGNAQKWVANNIITLMHQVSKKDKTCIGIVLSPNAFAEFGVKNIASSASDISTTKFFNHIQDAKSWLSQESLQQA